MFPFCEHCTYRNDEFKCHDCYGTDNSVHFLESDLPDGSPVACGCDYVDYVHTVQALPSTGTCERCHTLIDHCHACLDDGTKCIECEDGYYEDE